MSGISKTIRSLWQSVSGVVLAHPAVFTMLLYSSLLVDMDLISSAGDWIWHVAAAPIFVVAALGIDYNLSGKMKLLSWLIVPLLPLTMLIPGIDDWAGSISFMITMSIVLPLVMFVFKRPSTDEGFIKNAVWLFWSLFLALAMTSILVLALAGICWSVETLFGVEMETAIDVILATGYILAAPMLLVGLWEKEDLPSISRIADIVINWILSPAIICYTAVLLAYIVKIVATWNLPCGGVAVMCLVWGMTMVFIAAAQPVLTRHPFSWLVRIHGYLAIPLVVMLWVATVKRVADYGITPERYFLFVSDIAMTLFIAFPLFRVRNGYTKATAVTAAMFILGMVVPGANFRSVSDASQQRRADAAATELSTVPQKGFYLYLESGDQMDISTEGYTRISFGIKPEITGDGSGRAYFEVEGTRAYLDTLVSDQLARAGLDSDSISESLLEEHKKEFLIYETPGFTIFFRTMALKKESGGNLSVNEDFGRADIAAVLFR